MKITRLEIENYKGFKGKYTFDFKSNFIFLVGDNNTGKTSVLEAIDFLISGLPGTKILEDIKNKNSAPNDNVIVTMILQGNIKNIINNIPESSQGQKYSPYVFEENGVETLKLQRSSQISHIKQNGKDITLGVDKITMWNPVTQRFENPSGFDKVVKILFETQFIWSDMNPDDIMDFGSTKICGKLLSNIFYSFQSNSKWKEFKTQYQSSFYNGEDSLSALVKPYEQRIQDIFSNQYGKATITFNFGLPDATNFLKLTRIDVDDGVKTDIGYKGSGMQRSIALAILQVYAQELIQYPEDISKTKPLFFFIDEPELTLHPKAQVKLLEALLTISATCQIFITTHTPFLLKQYHKLSNDLFVFNKDQDSKISVSNSIDFNLFPWSPSFGEIVYRAFDIPSEELHDELYGWLQEKEHCPHINCSKNNKESIENYFVSRGYKQSYGPLNETLMTYIRNEIHHQETEKRRLNKYSSDQLRESINNMVKLLKESN